MARDIIVFTHIWESSQNPGVQVAVCAILLSGTALLVRALDRARHIETGFQFLAAAGPYSEVIARSRRSADFDPAITLRCE